LKDCSNSIVWQRPQRL